MHKGSSLRMAIYKSNHAQQTTKRPDNPSYEVGFGRPPEASRFKPGKSGNPKGRPKGKRNKLDGPRHERLKSIILQEAYRTIKVNDGPTQITVPMAQAVIRSLAVTAAKGNTRAQKLFSELLSNTESSNKQAEDDIHATMIEYKTDWEIELERRDRNAISTLPEPLPHPDDIIVDMRRNTVVVHGPMDKRELADLDLWLARKNDNEAELQYFVEKKIKFEYSPYLDQLERDITRTKRILEIINTALAFRASPNCIERRTLQLSLKTPDYLIKLSKLDDLEATS
jgi:hypothetical protein